MPVQFAGNLQADLMFVLGIWHELMSSWHPTVDPMAVPMLQRHAKQTLTSYLQTNGEDNAPRAIAERACGFDIVLRLASGRIDMMHATRAFFAHPENSQWFVSLPRSGPDPTRVLLTDAARAAWNAATEPDRARAREDARRLLESDIESGGFIVRLLPREPASRAIAARSENASVSLAQERTSRTDYLRALVRDIDTDPFQPVYRKRSLREPVEGWGARLDAYFWPGPDRGYLATLDAMRALVEASGQLAQALSSPDGWSDAQQARAVALAHDVFAWGGVPQDPKTVTPATVRAVYEAALRDDPAATTRMNSGWTKVAAFATAYLEDTPGGRPHAIWDSRVASAVISRLERVVPMHVDVAALFPGIGTVPGRGGTRPRELARAWPSGYRTWRAQVAGSQIVRDIRDLLNEEGARLLRSNGGPTRWATRDVEMVLFMDGY